VRTLILLVIVSVAGYMDSLAQSPQFSQFYANPIYSNPAFAGDAGASRFIVNYRNQWASIGTPFQTAAFSFDTYADDVGIGVGVQALHDQRGPALVSDQLSAQISKMIFLDAQKELRLIGGFQAAWASNRWNGDNLTYVSQFLGSQDPLAAVPLSSSRFTVSGGAILEYVPRNEDEVAYWFSTAWHNVGVNDPVSIEHQRLNFQLGSKIPVNIPSFFGNYLGSEMDRQSTLNLGLQIRKQGMDRQMEAGFNMHISPLVLGAWYRGMIFGKSRRDALVGTAGWAYGNMFFQASYDLPVSSLGVDTGAFEISIWYGLDSLFSLAGKGAKDRRSRRCMRY
jgi:type IX secretion system PorP/SprF family membrane protein